MNRIINVNSELNFDNSITDLQFHSHNPYSSNTFGNNDEIRIPIHQQDVYTLPSESFILIEGKIKKQDGTTDDTTTNLINNAIAFLFEEIRYELCGTEIDRVKNVGLTTTMKNILTARPGDVCWMSNAGWNLKTVNTIDDKTNFSFCVPLKLLLGFAEDFKEILLNVKQELVLLRSSSDKNSILQAAPNVHSVKFNIDKIVWKMPYVKIDDEIKLSLLKLVEKDQPLRIAFRRWQMHEYPVLPETTSQTWTVKTLSVIEKPRYVIVGFQTDRKDQSTKNSSHFDFCDLNNFRLYLNGTYYPYDPLNGKKSLFYEYYSKFQSSYYTGNDNQPCLEKKDFLEKIPLFVCDCSKQTESMKSGTVDVRLEIETSTAIPPHTAAYCLIISDALVYYSPLSGTVKKVM